MSETAAPPILLLDEAGDVLPLSPKRARWAREHYDLVQPRAEADYVWTDQGGRSVEAILAELEAQPSLRECDFCRAEDVTWLVNHDKPFVKAHRELRYIDRPFWSCDTCAELIAANKKRALLERATEALLALMPGGTPGDRESYQWAWAGQKRRARERVSAMFSVRKGFPVRIEPGAEPVSEGKSAGSVANLMS